MKSKTRFNNNIKGIECLNCKQPISNKDNFCSDCGQVNDLRPLSVKQYLKEFLSGFFAFDTRTLNTIIPLLTKPGTVSSEYIKGKRAKYVNPFKLYLHTSIIFFLIIGIFSISDNFINIKTENNTNTNKTVNIDTLNRINYLQIQKIIDRNVDSIFKNPEFKKILNGKTTHQKNEVMDIYMDFITDTQKYLRKNYVAENDSLTEINFLKDEFIRISEQKLKEKNINFKFNDFTKLPVENQLSEELENNGILYRISVFSKSKTKNVYRALDSLKLSKTKTNVFLYLKTQKLKKLFKKDGNDVFNNYKQEIISKISIALFFVLPVFAGLLYLLYIRRKYTYTEHLIFIFNTQTVFLIALLTGILLDRIFYSDIFVNIFLLFFLVYLFLSVKRFYKQKFFKTSIKTIIMIFSYLFLSLLGILVLSILVLIIF